MTRTMTLRDGDRVIHGFEYGGEAYAYERIGDGRKEIAYLSTWYRDNVSTSLDSVFDAFTHMALLCARYLGEAPKSFANEPPWAASGLIPAAVLALDEEGADGPR